MKYLRRRNDIGRLPKRITTENLPQHDTDSRPFDIMLIDSISTGRIVKFTRMGEQDWQQLVMQLPREHSFQNCCN